MSTLIKNWQLIHVVVNSKLPDLFNGYHHVS